jgi:hypothetical protein
MTTATATPQTADAQGMHYLVSLPRRVVTIYVPLFAFLFVLLFPFYWMTITAVKPDAELLSRDGNPFWVIHPTLVHIKKLLFDTAYPDWLWNTIVVSVASTFLSIFCSVLAAYAIERLRFRGSRYAGMSIFLAYLVPPSILFIPLAAMVYKLNLFDTRLALILTYPTFLIPFGTWLLMGVLQIDSARTRRMRADRWRKPTADSGQDHPAAGGTRTDFCGHFRVHAVVERIHLRADLCLVVGSEDGSGRGGHGAGRRRRLPLGVADGRRTVRFPAGGTAVLVLRRVLRVGSHRGGEGIALTERRVETRSRNPNSATISRTFTQPRPGR